MNEIQLQKPNSNIYCYVNFSAIGGEIIVDCNVVEYNPETEENKPLYTSKIDIFDFTEQFRKKEWIVC